MDLGSGEVYVVAELANTHEGDEDRAKSIIEAISDHADAVKIQAYTADELTTPDHPNYASFDEKSFSETEWSRIIGHAKEHGLDIFADVFGTESLERMSEIGVEGYKLHAADISNRDLLSQVAATGDPVFLSAGGSTVQKIQRAIAVLKSHGSEPSALIYGFQRYPTACEDTHLRKIQALAERFDYPIGFAPHLDGDAAVAPELPSWSVAAGADVVEIHVTTNRSEEPADYHSSLSPADFQTAVKNVRRLTPTLGDWSTDPNDAERQYRVQHKKYVVATSSIEADEQISKEKIALKRVPDPNAANFTDPDAVVGRTATADIEEFEPVSDEDVSETIAAVLACRAESDRLYGKPMQLIGERPIIQHLVDRLELVDRIGEIVLAAADIPSKSIFAEYAEDNGYRYVVGSETDVLERLIQGANLVDAETIVRVTTENPYLYWESVNDLIERHQEHGNDLTTMESLPSGTHAEVISRDALERSHSEGEDRHRSELCTLYINENSDVFDIERVEPPEALRRPDLRLTVDYPSDLIVAREVFEGVETDDRPVPLEDIVQFLQQNPDVAAINTQNPNETRLYD